MKIFQCDHCGNPAFFENIRCERCGAALGYLAERTDLLSLAPAGDRLASSALPDQYFRYCQNHSQGACNWLVPSESDQPFCPACQLNETIPDLSDPERFSAWQTIEQAKRRLIYGLMRLGLPLQSRSASPVTGLAFRFLSDEPLPEDEKVLTGHKDGVITLNIAEADPAHREAVRQQMGEPFRTLIGHFRHEIGHYYWQILVRTGTARLDAFRSLFGDERLDYSEALTQYHQNGPPANWQGQFLSAYSTMHPWEDWAETWAYYMHLIDLLETANAFGISINAELDDRASLRMLATFDAYAHPDFDEVYEACVPLSLAVNSLNRSMGQPDLNPFIIPPPVREKLRFVHDTIAATKEGRPT